DPCNRAQTLDPSLAETAGDCKDDPSVALLGKMLRIDVNSSTQATENTNLCSVGAGNAAEYAVPTENPYADRDDRCGEVLLYGLRNPWRWSFDRATDDLWIGDVGQDQWEEINLLPAPADGTFETAENLGWNCFEGPSTFSTENDCPPPSPVFPVLEYDHASTGGCSVTGGYRYRGFIRSLRGRYIYGDFCSGNIWFADDDTGKWQEEEFTTGFSGLRSFGEDETGNVYAIAAGQLYRFIGEEIFIDSFED
ncbi:MAG: PQQ-dependent sugar dehydrogenase, partial [Wenzhouxiangellaceae bacterium]|nr:PQQ-dependent sugar dehydrogenase [Wenzhouxiangellaceae bacterium]